MSQGPAIPAVVVGNSQTAIVVTQNDDRQYDDEGIPYVNPNVPGADIATGDKQTAIINALAALLLTPAVSTTARSISNALTITSLPLPPNAAIETAGNIQRIADTLELILSALRTQALILSQLQQPFLDGPDRLADDTASLN